MNEQEIFSAALEREPDERAAFLDEVCGDDGRMRRQVEDLLQLYEPAQGLFEKPAGEIVATADQAAPQQTGDTIGPYKLLEKVGEGGMGEVYVAEQSEPVHRKVALKVIKPGMDTAQVVARFEAERQALAMMNHPNIAKVLDAGATDSGRPYFVMDLVKGIPVTGYCDRHRLNLNQRLELFITVCEAVQHAHQKGVIHRDLKPSNILVELHDVRAVPKVIDFGVAKATNDKLTSRTLHTGLTQMVGTPTYMSPEQAELSGLDVDTRSDVYSLGVLLYETLTGTAPLEGETLRQAGFDEMRRMIREDEPIRPSERVSTMAAGDLSTLSEKRQIDPQQLSRRLRGELDWIVLKSLEKDRKRRYQSAREMAEDVHRYLSGDSVQACPPSLSYKARKTAAKHKWLLLTVSAVLFTAIVGAVAASWFAVDASARAREAIAATELAEEQAEKANAATAETELARKSEYAQRKTAELARYRADVRWAASQIDAGQNIDALNTLRPHFQSRHISWELAYLASAGTKHLRTWRASSRECEQVDWSPDGAHIAVAAHDGVKVFRATGELSHEWNQSSLIDKAVAWSPDGRRLAYADAHSAGNVYIWDRETDSTATFCPNGTSVWSLEWSGDSEGLIVAGMRYDQVEPAESQVAENLFRYRLENGEWQLKASARLDHHSRSAAWSADERHIFALPGITILDAGNLSRLDTLSEPTATQLAVASSTNHLFVARRNGMIAKYSLEGTVEELSSWQAHDSEIVAIKISPHDELIATASRDGQARVWTTNSARLVASFQAHDGVVTDVAWNPDAKKIVTVGKDGRLSIWPVVDQLSRDDIDLRRVDAHAGFRWTSDNQLRAVDPEIAAIVDIDPNSDERTRVGLLPATPIRLIDQDRFLQWTDHKIEMRTISTGKLLQSIPDIEGKFERDRIVVSKNNADQSLIAWQIDDANPQIFNLAQGTGRKLLPQDTFRGIKQLEWSPDYQWLALVGGGWGASDGTVRHAAWLHLFSREDWNNHYHVRIGDATVKGTALAWSPDGNMIAAANHDGTCVVYERESLELLSHSRIHRSDVYELCWHPDGTRVASVGGDGIVNIWNPTKADVYMRLHLGNSVAQLSFSPNGRFLAAMDDSGSIQVWDAQRGFEIAESVAQQPNELTVSFMDSASLAARATMYLHCKDYDRALTDADRALEAANNASQEFEALVLKYLVLHRKTQTAETSAIMQRIRTHIETESEQFSAYTCNNLAWLLVVFPTDDIQHYQLAVEIAAIAVRKDDRGIPWNTLGTAQFRAKDYAASITSLKTSLARDAYGKEYNALFLAMAHYQLGKVGEAKEWYRKAIDWSSKTSTDAELLRFREEARQLLEATGKEGKISDGA